ncbi:MAG TPA: Fe2+-dependent dioxygenase [Terricaulis sp.]|nr:Fe2+-dependent dioxygenase [Terricaulis sp.]HRP09569.1 Fe2+-dependent dioxygenase [Terricaulis sp.]
MLVSIPNVLTPAQVAEGRKALEGAEWVDGRVTAGHQGAHVKNNRQLPQNSEAGRAVGEMILRALSNNPLFMSAALPLHVLTPTFNRYEGGEAFGNHVDGAMRFLPNGQRMRTDLSCTLFFSEPGEYEGGELIIDDVFGSKSVKLPAGHMILYPSTSVHQVTPVTKGVRLSSFFWMQSMIRDNAQRAMLFDMDRAIQGLGAENGATHPGVVQLTGVYHNLLRMWGEV